jgi:subfamily B ATP-binding cassette protein MsbA
VISNAHSAELLDNSKRPVRLEVRESLTNLRRIGGYIKPYVGWLILAFILLTFNAGLMLVLPQVVGQLVDVGWVENNLTSFNQLALALLLIFAAQAVLGFGGSWLLLYVGERVVANVRINVYRRLQLLSLKFYNDHRAGEIISCVTNDTSVFQEVVTNHLPMVFSQILYLTASAGMLFYLNWRLTLTILAGTPVVVLILLLLGLPTQRISRSVQERLAQMVSVFEETISGIRVVKSFARQAYEITRFTQSVEQVFQMAMLRARIAASLGALIGLIASIAILIALSLGSREVIAGSLTPGNLIAYLLYTLMIAGGVAMLAGLYAQLQKVLGASQRVFELLDTQPDVADRPDAAELPPIRGCVTFERVSFGYNGSAPVLSEVSFRAEPGEVIALVGPSGAGKTTVVNLLARFYDVGEGRVCIDEYDVRGVTQHSLQSQIGIVPQETLLFGGAVAENIRYGKLEATPAEIEAAARAANAHEFILHELPDGYATVVGERGAKLSGGQRQRIAIARAILKDPRILILDEATSSLDSESEQLIQEALERLMRGRTTFVIAHRLSTIVNADKILVLSQGRVVEQGTHRELLDRGGVYRRLHDFQFAF